MVNPNASPSLDAHKKKLLLQNIKALQQEMGTLLAHNHASPKSLPQSLPLAPRATSSPETIAATSNNSVQSSASSCPPRPHRVRFVIPARSSLSPQLQPRSPKVAPKLASRKRRCRPSVSGDHEEWKEGATDSDDWRDVSPHDHESSSSSSVSATLPVTARPLPHAACRLRRLQKKKKRRSLFKPSAAEEQPPQASGATTALREGDSSETLTAEEYALQPRPFACIADVEVGGVCGDTGASSTGSLLGWRTTETKEGDQKSSSSSSNNQFASLQGDFLWQKFQRLYALLQTPSCYSCCSSTPPPGAPPLPAT